MSDPLIVFDIETIPDAAHHTDDSFPKPLFHQVVAISFLEAHLESSESGSFYAVDLLRSGGDAGYTEAQLIKGFFQYVEKKKPRLVTFNGRGFDLPVLKYRAMKHEVSARWFAQGEGKWDNYQHRYSVDWHFDLMDALADHGASKNAGLDEVCGLLALPGKIGMDGTQVKGFFEAGRIQEIRNYCETDVLSTYLIFLRFALFRGEISAAGHAASIDNLKAYLNAARLERPHLGAFLDVWAAKNSASFMQPTTAQKPAVS